MDDQYNELTQKIITREHSIRNSRLKKQLYVLGAMIPVMFVVLIGYVVSLTGRVLETQGVNEAYGTALTASEAGGYIFTAVIAFVLGALITLFCIKFKKVSERKDE
jgi:hypothetical protein